jgi:acetyltransferase-like isoleucine patch superfamily enzyme
VNPEGQWPVALPSNATIGDGSRVTADALNPRGVFLRFRSVRESGLTIGRRSILEDVTFNIGPDGQVEIGNDCLLQSAFLIGERSLKIGHRVTLSWHVIVVDSDFHPLGLEERIIDAQALSSQGRAEHASRPVFVSRPVILEDDVWVGANAMILKGVTIGSGAVIEPGAVVTRDVPAGARMMGNPAEVMDAPGRS